MKDQKIEVSKLRLDRSKCDPHEIVWLKSMYLKRMAIPQPIVNDQLEVIGFFNSAAVLIDLDIKEIYVVKKDLVTRTPLST